MGVSETACGRGGKLDPSPYPLPWTWTGGFASGQSVQDGPRWPQEGPRELKSSSSSSCFLRLFVVSFVVAVLLEPPAHR